MASSLRKIPIKRNENYKKSGIKSYAWLLNKYSLTPAEDGPFYRAEPDTAAKNTHQKFLYAGQPHVGRLMKKVEGAAGHPVTTQDIQTDTLYLSEVEVKGQAQSFWLDFDTGSSDLWILGKSLADQFDGTTNHNLFDTAHGWNPIAGATFEIWYGDNSHAAGKVGNADIVVGGLTIKGQAVEVADNVDQSFITGEGDGLLGLAFGSINSVKPNRVMTPVENMILQEDIPKGQELFTCKLGNSHDPHDTESFYTFGFVDQPTLNAAGTPVHYTSLLQHNADGANGFWRFKSTSMVVNGQQIDRSNNTAIADTGTTLAVIDDASLKKIYSTIPGAKISRNQGGWIYPADTKVENLPSVSFDVGGKQFAIPKENLGFGQVSEGGKDWIFGSIQSRGARQPFDILGDAFLKGVYAIFDQGNKRFGVVQRQKLRQNID